MTHPQPRQKLVRWDWEHLTAYDDTTPVVKLLTERDVQLFGAIAVAAYWFRTRWLNAPQNTHDAIDAYVSDALERLFAEVDICALVADCIRGSQAVRDALAEYGIATSTPDSAPNGQGANALSGVACNNDDVYGAAEAIVDFADAVSQDLLERVANDVRFGSALLRLIDAIPVVGDLPLADDLSDLVTWITDSGLSVYQSGFTTGLRQDLICALYCQSISKSPCDLMAKDILQAYADESAVALAVQQPLELLFRALTLSVTDTEFAVHTNILVLSALAAGGEVLGFVGMPTIEQIAATSDPDTDWQVFCTSCAWVEFFDFTAQAYNQYVSERVSGRGIFWTSGIGWQTQIIGGEIKGGIRFTPPTALTSVDIELTLVLKPNSNNLSNGLILRDNGLNIVKIVTDNNGPQGGTQTRTYSVQGQDARYIDVLAQTADPGFAHIKSLKISGTGVNPF